MRAVGWLWVGLSVAVLLAFGVDRLTQTFVTPGAADPFGVRYVEHPAIGLLHIVPGLLFLASIGTSQALTGLDMEAVFGASFWAGVSINALVAEGWIRWTRRPFQRAR